MGRKNQKGHRVRYTPVQWAVMKTRNGYTLTEEERKMNLPSVNVYPFVIKETKKKTGRMGHAFFDHLPRVGEAY